MSEIPDWLGWLAREVRGRRWDSAKRAVVAKVGSVGRNERFGDDVADAVFLRVQENAQVGRYASEAAVLALGRGARRLEGPGTITLYRCAPRGAGIRPGDFASDAAHEAGFYRHGGNVLHEATVPRDEVFQVEGTTGGGREYVHLPRGYVAPVPEVPFATFAAFYEAANAPEPAASPAP